MDVLDSLLAVRENSDLTPDAVMFERFADQGGVGRIIFDKYDRNASGKRRGQASGILRAV